MLIGFTVTQFAFRSLEPLYGARPASSSCASLAVDGAGAAGGNGMRGATR